MQVYLDVIVIKSYLQIMYCESIHRRGKKKNYDTARGFECVNLINSVNQFLAEVIITCGLSVAVEIEG